MRGGGLALPAQKMALLGKMTTFLLLFLFFFSKAEAQSTSLIQVLNPSSVSLTSAEQAKFSQIQSLTTTASVQHVQINPIQNYLSGQSLTIQLPNSNQATVFLSDCVISKPNGEYYWTGANADGSTITLGNYNSGYLGSIFHAPSQTQYTMYTFAPGKDILVKHQPGYLADANDCGTSDGPDEDPNNEVIDRSECESNTVRVLVLFTPAAAASASGLNPLVVGPAIVAELNASSLASNLSANEVTFVLAGTVLLPGFLEQANDLSGDVDLLASNATAIATRNATFADVVVLIADDVYSGSNGIAKDIAASAANAFCIAEITAAATLFTGSHEVAHLFGARHQRCYSCSAACSELSFGHGFRIGEDFQTIMRVNCDNTPRVGRWSTPGVPFMSFPTGNVANNNAKKLRDRAGKVSCFRGAVPGLAYEVKLSGTRTICDGDDDQNLSAIFNPAGFAPPVTVTWERSFTGFAPWTILGCSGNQCTLTGINSFPAVYYVRLTVSDAAGNSASDILEVKKVFCLGGSGGDRDASENTYISDGVSIYPNPANEQLIVSGIESVATIILSDLSGTVVLQKNLLAISGEKISIDISRLPQGIYFAVVKQGKSIVNTKILKI